MTSPPPFLVPFARAEPPPLSETASSQHLSDSDQLDRLIGQLGSSEFQTREIATKRLAAMGWPALASLQQAATGNRDAEIRHRARLAINSITEVSLVCTFGGHRSTERGVALSSDNKHMLSADDNGVIRLWNVATTQKLWHKVFDGVTGIAGAFAPDGQHVLVGCGAAVRLFDVRTGREVRSFAGHKGFVFRVAFSPNGKKVLSGGSDKTVRLWDVETGAQLWCRTGHTAQVNAVGFSPDGIRVVSAGADSTIRVWDVQTGKELMSIAAHRHGVADVSFSPDGKHLLSAGSDEIVVFDGKEALPVPETLDSLALWEARTGKQLLRARDHLTFISAVAFLDNKYLLSGDHRGGVCLWDARTGKLLGRFQCPAGAGPITCFSRDRRQVLTTLSERGVGLWRLGK